MTIRIRRCRHRRTISRISFLHQTITCLSRRRRCCTGSRRRGKCPSPRRSRQGFPKSRRRLSLLASSSRRMRLRFRSPWRMPSRHGRAGHLAMVPKRMRQPDCMLPARTDGSLWGMINRRRSRRPRGRFLRNSRMRPAHLPIALWPAATGASRIRSGVCGACAGSISVCAAESAVE